MGVADSETAATSVCSSLLGPRCAIRGGRLTETRHAEAGAESEAAAAGSWLIIISNMLSKEKH